MEYEGDRQILELAGHQSHRIKKVYTRMSLCVCEYKYMCVCEYMCVCVCGWVGVGVGVGVCVSGFDEDNSSHSAHSEF